MILAAISIIAIALFITAAKIAEQIQKFIVKFTPDYRDNSNAYVEVDSNDEFRELSNVYNAMLERIDLLIQQVYKQQLLMKDAQIESLQAQINPHFLYNTLDCINSLADMGKTAEVKKTVTSLGSIMRMSIKGAQFLKIEEELNNLLITIADLKDILANEERILEIIRNELLEMKEKYGRIPVFIQYNFMYSIHARFEGNMDNRNKHVIEEGHGEEYLELIGKALGLIEESIMLNRNKIAACITGDTMKWVYGILRNGQDYRFQRFFLAGKIYYGIGDTLFNSVMSLSTNILFINYRDGKLEIDGTVHPILYSMADEIYFKYNNVKYKIEYNGRYGLTKAFGAAICKRHSFHLSIPVAKKNETAISCEAKFGTQIEAITLRFSHPIFHVWVCGSLYKQPLVLWR